MPRVLPADVYDTLELSALAYGGIGGGNFRDYDDQPLCVIGHAVDAAPGMPYVDFLHALNVAGISLNTNDRAVRSGRRISFREWCRRLNVVRGDQ